MAQARLGPGRIHRCMRTSGQREVALALLHGHHTQARVDVSAIKVVAARLQTRVVNRAMQGFGAMGLSPDTPWLASGPEAGPPTCWMARTKCICAPWPA